MKSSARTAALTTPPLLADGAKSGAIRKDVAPDELATFCLHAIGGASDLTSKAAVRRLVKVILAGVRTAEP